MKLGCIASGSSGNSTYVGSANANILVDAGISGKKIIEGLLEYGVDACDIDALLITHEHIDHISGVGVLARKLKVPIYATKGTIDALASAKVGKIDESLFNVIKAGDEFVIRDITVKAIKISHDAAEPVAYSFESNNKKIAIITDLGYYDEGIVDKLRGVNAIVLEANHDVRLVQVGPYPYHLKQRILCDSGHLSNENAGKLLKTISHSEMKAVFLGHLSGENNTPELAYETVRLEFFTNNEVVNETVCKLEVANRNNTTPLVKI